MSGLENRLMLALRSRKIKEYGFDDISSFCVLLIVQTYALLGYQNYNKTDVSLLARRLATDLYESYGYLSKEEVQRATLAITLMQIIARLLCGSKHISDVICVILVKCF